MWQSYVPATDVPKTKQPRFTSPISFLSQPLFTLLTALLMLSLTPTLVKANLIDGCAESYDSNLDYFPDKINVEHASFKVEYKKNYKLVTNLWTSEQYYLYQCGTPAPTNSSIKSFSIPVKRAALASTVDLTFMERLGLRTSIEYVQGPQYISSPCLRASVTQGLIQALSSNSTIKKTQLSLIDVFFTDSVDPSDLNAVTLSTAYDPGTLNRSEWIKFISLFFNLEATATRVIDAIDLTYGCTKNLAASSTQFAPLKVAWIDYKNYQANLYAIDVAAYKLQFVQDAGGITVAPVNNYETADITIWQENLKDVDVLIDQTYLGTLETFYTNFKLNATSNFKFIQNKQIYRFDKLQSELGALDWFESAVANPDAVLQDILTFTKPHLNFNHERIWFRNVYINEPVVYESTCSDVTSSTSTRASSCELKVDSVDPTPTSGFVPLMPNHYVMIIISLIFILFY